MRYPAVLLPGLQSDRRSWLEQTRYFAGKREIIIPEGHELEPSIEGMAESILPKLPQRFHFVPWSMGGYIALYLLPRLRGRLASLTLVATSARAEDAESTRRRQEIIAIAERDGMKAAAECSFDAGCYDASRVRPEVREAVIQSKIDLGLACFRSQQDAVIKRPATFAHLPSILAPTLILAGENDGVVSPECATELHENIPGSRLQMFTECGHCLPFEIPDKFNAILENWVSENETAAERRIY